MTALLRADWLRFRRRRDFWIIGIAVAVLAVLTFFAAWRSEAGEPEFPNEAQIRLEATDFLFFEGTPEEVAAQVDLYVTDQLAQYEQQRLEYKARQAIDLQKYAFPQSVFTVVGSGLAALLAIVLVTSLAVGDEFRFGTIRTSLLAAGNRRRFLAARLVSLVAMTVGLTLALVLLGAILGLVLVLVGADVGRGSTPIDPASSIAWIGAQILTTMTVIALATFLTVLLRSGALPLLLILIGGLVELFVANLPIFAPNELLAGVPQAFLTTNLQRLGAQLGLDTHALALARAELRPAAIDVPLLGVAAIVAAWGVLFVVLADRRLRTMDVVE